MENFDDVKEFDVKKELLPEQGKQLTQTKSTYQAAVMVPKPRSIKKIIDAVIEEATEAKDDFYYSWLVNNKKTGKKDPIEGGTIGLAQAIARNWTNCAIETEVKEFGGEWIFKTTFVDFENGFTTQREFRMLIPQKGSGNYDYERTRNMKFQIGQSKNQRDCIFNAIPRWLKNQAIAVAKAAAQKEAKVDPEGKLKKALASFKEKGITETVLLGYFGKKSIKEFDSKIITQLRNLWVQLDNGETTVNAIKRAAQDVFDEKPKHNRKKKQEKATSVKEMQKKIDIMTIAKSLELHGISETEICAYFGITDLIEMDTEEGLFDLQKIVSDIEGEKLQSEEFKRQAAERSISASISLK